MDTETKHQDHISNSKQGYIINLLLPILNELQWPKNYRKLHDILKNCSNNISISDLYYILNKFNIIINRKNFNVDEYSGVKFPILYCDRSGNFNLIISRLNNRYTIIDGKTKKTYTTDSIIRTKECYFFEKTNNTSKNWYTNIFAPFSKIIKKLFITSFIANVFTLSIPLFIMLVYDKVIPSESTKILIQFSIGAMLCILCFFAISYTRSILFSYFSSKIEKDLQNKIFKKLIGISPSLVENASVSSQFSKFKDFDNIKQLLANPTVILLLDVPFLILALLTVGILSFKLMLVPLAIFAVYAFIYIFYKKKIQYLQTNDSLRRDYLQSFIIETLSKLRTIKGSLNYKNWMDRYNVLKYNQYQSEQKSTNISSMLSVVSDACMYISGILIAYLGAIKVLDNSLSVGALIAIMILSWRILSPLKALISLLPKVEQIKLLLIQANKLLNIKDEESEQLDNMISIKGDIEFSRVSFRYSNNHTPALLGVSFSIKAGTICCITGDSGSGKSSIIKLIAKFYAPQAGVISVDGQNIQQLDSIQLRQLICFQPQSNHLFVDTILENLLLNNPIADSKAVERAVKSAGIYDYISSLPRGLNTILSEETLNLLPSSIIQKIILARSYLKPSNLYVLDEPTKFLDENGIYKFIYTIKDKQAEKGSTFIISTRDSNVIKCADQVIHLSDSNVYYSGNYTNYRKLLNSTRDIHA